MTNFSGHDEEDRLFPASPADPTNLSGRLEYDADADGAGDAPDIDVMSDVIGGAVASSTVETSAEGRDAESETTAQNRVLRGAIDVVLDESMASLTGHSLGIGQALISYMEQHHQALPGPEDDAMHEKARRLAREETEHQDEELSALSMTGRRMIDVAQELKGLHTKAEAGGVITSEAIADIYTYARQAHDALKELAAAAVERDNLLRERQGHDPVSSNNALRFNLPPIA